MIRVDEMHIKIPGKTRETGNALGRYLAERLAENIPEPEGNVYIPEIKVRLQSASAADTQQTADRIAEQIISKIKLETL
jgi:hypothetical protein